MSYKTFIYPFFLLLILQKSILANEKSVSFASGEFPPFSSSQMKNYGLASEVIIQACKLAHLKCNISFYPWLRVEDLVQKGKVFGAFPYVFTEERSKKYFFSETIYSGDVRIFYLKKNNKKFYSLNNQSIDKFDNKTIFGYVRGNFYKDILDKLNKQSEESSDNIVLTKKLITERVDLIIDNYHVFNHYLNKYYPNFKNQILNINVIDFKSLPNMLIVSKTYPSSEKILEIINIGIKKLKENGSYDKILLKYNY